MRLTINSKEYIVSTNFAENMVAEGYNELVRNIGVFNREFALELVSYLTVNTVWCFDVTNAPTAGCEYVSRPSPSATWSIHAEFETPLPENVQAFVITEIDKVLAIDKNHSVDIMGR